MLLVASLTLSSCVLARSVGQSETSTGGNERLQTLSNEANFLDLVEERVLIDAEVIETGDVTSQVLAGAEPIDGSVQFLGEAAGIRSARWKENLAGSIVQCEGWFASSGGTWTCGDEAQMEGDFVDYMTTCYSNKPPETLVLTVDEDIVALRFDLSDGTSVVSVDPDDRGLLALRATGGIAAALAQTVDGTVYQIESVQGAALCAGVAVARPQAG